MTSQVFLSFKETDREYIDNLVAKIDDPENHNLKFEYKPLVNRWDTVDMTVIRREVISRLEETSRTIVLLGEETHRSFWVPIEVEQSLKRGSRVFAIRLEGQFGKTPTFLTDNGIKLHSWSEARLQKLATEPL